MEIPALFYACLIGVTVFLGIIFLFINVRRYNEDFFRAEKILLFSVPISVIIGRIGYVLLNFEEFRSDLSAVFAFWQGGISPVVAFVSFFILIFCYSEVHALKAFLWFDIFMIPMIFVISLHEIGLFALFPVFGDTFLDADHLFSIIPIGFTEREFLQNTALVEGIVTFIMTILLMRLKKSNEGAVFFLGLSLFCAIRFITVFFYIVSVPIVFSAPHIMSGFTALTFMCAFLFMIKTDKGGRA